MSTKKSVGVAAGAAVVLAPLASGAVTSTQSSAPANVQEKRTGSGQLVYADGAENDVWGIVCTTTSGLVCKA